MRWTVLDSPIGEFSVATDGEAVCRAHFGRLASAQDAAGDELASRAVAELRAYFAGELSDFSVPLSVPGGSEFEQAVWRELSAIPYGVMRTYGELATRLGDPGAARAVGTACNRNPIPVLVPCHRVVGAGGKLVGFGGGLDRKRRLLELEAAVVFQQSWS